MVPPLRIVAPAAKLPALDLVMVPALVPPLAKVATPDLMKTLPLLAISPVVNRPPSTVRREFAATVVVAVRF